MRGGWFGRLVMMGVMATPGVMAVGQVAGCATQPVPTAADQDYLDEKYDSAEAAFREQVREHPDDVMAVAGLVKTLAREGKTTVAEGLLQPLLAAQPHSAPLLTALAETEMREGRPWLAQEHVDAAIAADPCYARAELVRARLLRMSSEYLSERKALQLAYDLDPKNREIAGAWKRIVSPAADAASSMEYLRTTKNVDPEVRKAAEVSIAGIMPALSETSQTCQVLPKESSATLPLLPSMRDGKELDGYKLEVQLPQTRVRLALDTAASGLYLSRAVADANGLQHREGDPPGTARVESMRIGPLEFRDCLVGVNDGVFPEKAEGYISTDLFDQYLVTLKFREAKLELSPLPGEAGDVPGDRSTALEKEGYFPVYRKLQYLLVPVTLNGKEKRLFPLDTGMRSSTLDEPVVTEVMGPQKHLTNTLTSVSGKKLQVYRDTFDYGFPGFVVRHQGNIFDIETTGMENKAGVQFGGLLGFDLLRGMTVHLDYRDGLVKMEAPTSEATPAAGSAPMQVAEAAAAGSAAAMPACAHEESQAGGTVVQAKTTGMWDAAHMKAGEQVVATVLQEYTFPECVMEQNSLVYGHVVQSSGKGAKPMLAVLFDHADCRGKGKQAVKLEMIGLSAPPSEFKGLQDALPTSIGGGQTRSISDAVSALENGTPQNLAGGAAAKTLMPGTVLGRPDMKLEVEGGPSCSALLTDTAATLRLGSQSKLYLLATP